MLLKAIHRLAPLILVRDWNNEYLAEALLLGHPTDVCCRSGSKQINISSFDVDVWKEFVQAGSAPWPLLHNKGLRSPPLHLFNRN